MAFYMVSLNSESTVEVMHRKTLKRYTLTLDELKECQKYLNIMGIEGDCLYEIFEEYPFSAKSGIKLSDKIILNSVLVYKGCLRVWNIPKQVIGLASHFSMQSRYLEKNNQNGIVRDLEIIHSNHLKSIGRQAFKFYPGEGKLRELHLKGIEFISDGAFMNSPLESIDLINETGTITLDYGAFGNNKSLKRVYIKADKVVLKNRVFENNDALLDVKVVANETVMSSDVFLNCSNLKNPIIQGL